MVIVARVTFISVLLVTISIFKSNRKTSQQANTLHSLSPVIHTHIHIHLNKSSFFPTIISVSFTAIIEILKPVHGSWICGDIIKGKK